MIEGPPRGLLTCDLMKATILVVVKDCRGHQRILTKPPKTTSGGVQCVASTGRAPAIHHDHIGTHKGHGLWALTACIMCYGSRWAGLDTSPCLDLGRLTQCQSHPHSGGLPCSTVQEVGV